MLSCGSHPVQALYGLLYRCLCAMSLHVLHTWVADVTADVIAALSMGNAGKAEEEGAESPEGSPHATEPAGPAKMASLCHSAANRLQAVGRQQFFGSDNSQQ